MTQQTLIPQSSDSPHQVVSSTINTINKTNKGLLVAVSIIATWFISLTVLFLLDLSRIPAPVIVTGILIQTFLFTGLFITAHDAMHGSLYPQSPKINHFIGAVSVFLYAQFDYKKLIKRHRQHHLHPATETDPDFHNNWNRHPLLWYFGFLTRYFSPLQFLGLATVYNVSHFVLHIPESNLTLFWVVPSLLSSAQLFFFGTFLPHRETAEGYQNVHRANSCSLPPFWSFLTCYHFGYHEEHHEYPAAPWWKLPEIRQLRNAGSR